MVEYARCVARNSNDAAEAYLSFDLIYSTKRASIVYTHSHLHSTKHFTSPAHLHHFVHKRKIRNSPSLSNSFLPSIHNPHQQPLLPLPRHSDKSKWPSIRTLSLRPRPQWQRTRRVSAARHNLIDVAVGGCQNDVDVVRAERVVDASCAGDVADVGEGGSGLFVGPAGSGEGGEEEVLVDA